MHQQDPDWGPNGLVAYHDNGIVWFNTIGNARVDPELFGIWIIDPATGEKRRIAPVGWLPDWSPDGSKLVFSTGWIYVIGADGSAPRLLTPLGDAWFPAWSPDGQTIAYDFWTGTPPVSVWLMAVDGSWHRNLLPGVASRFPSWSPDGAQIVHVRGTSGTPAGEVYIMDRDGSNARRITSNGWGEEDPVYSPDGAWIAFTKTIPSPGGIYIMRVDGTVLRLLTSEGRDPSWSPDGKRIVYEHGGKDPRSPESGVLWIIDVETLQETQLTHQWPQQDSP